MVRGVRRERTAGTAGADEAPPARSAREAWLASALLLLLFAAFCLTPNWGRILPEAWRQTGEIWREGTKHTAAARRAIFYDETYPVLWYLRENTPPDAVILLPPTKFMKDQVMSRRPPGEDLTPLLGLASSAYSFLYPRVPVHFGEAAPLLDRANYLLVWDHWGLDRIDTSLPKTEENRVRLFPASIGSDPAVQGSGGVPARWNGRTVEEETGPDRWITFGLGLGLAVLMGLGDGLLRLLRRARAVPVPCGAKPDRLESVALRVLLGLAAVPFVAMLFDLVSIPITRASFVAAAAVLVAAGWFLTRHRPAVPAAAGEVPPDRRSALRDRIAASSRSVLRAPAAAVLSLVAIGVVACTLVQIAILPERNYDALVGYDLVGKVMAYEGAYVSSVFQRITYNAQCVYAPFTAANIGFGYLFHPIIQRLWVTLLIGAFLVLFHRRVLWWSGSRTAASLALLLFFLPRVVLTQATVGMTDLPSMVFTALALFAVIDHLRGEGGVAPAVPMILAASTARTENFLLGGAMAVVVIAAGWRARRGRAPEVPEPMDRRIDRQLGRRLARWRGAWILVVPVLFFLFWNFLVVRARMGYDPAAHFTPPGVDPAKMIEVITRAFQIIGMRAAFGHFWVLIPIAVLIWIAGRARKGGESASVGTPTGPLLLVLGLMFLAYLPFFYLWDPVLNPLWTMEHTFKRGFMRFMPGIVAAVCCAPLITRALRRCER